MDHLAVHFYFYLAELGNLGTERLEFDGFEVWPLTDFVEGLLKGLFF